MIFYQNVCFLAKNVAKNDRLLPKMIGFLLSTVAKKRCQKHLPKTIILPKMIVCLPKTTVCMPKMIFYQNDFFLAENVAKTDRLLPKNAAKNGRFLPSLFLHLVLTISALLAKNK